MKFGIMFANTADAVLATVQQEDQEVHTTPLSSVGDRAVALATAAEDNGFESLWTVEHVVVPKGYASQYPYDDSGRMPGGREDFDITDPLIWLSYVASATRSIRLATGILILPQRNPVVLAKEIATLDQLSNGRVTLGVGVGWLEEEFDALGVPFARRGARTDDYVEALRALWTQDCASYEGEFTSFSNCYSRPQPVQGNVPIVIGGHSQAAARRAGRLGNGFFPGKGSIEELSELIQTMRTAAEDVGRDPDSIEITAGGGPPEHLQRLADLGVSRVMAPPMPPEGLARFAEEVIAKSG